MKTTLLAGLGAVLLALPGAVLAQSAASPAFIGVAESRAVLGGAPQPGAEPDASAQLTQLLHQLEQAAAPPGHPEAFAQLSLSTIQELAQLLTATRQRLADLEQELAAARRLRADLLLDHAELTDLRQQLNLLQSQQAALSAAPRHGMGYLAD